MKEWDCGVGEVREDVGLEKRERGVEPWRNGVESLRECMGGSWRRECVKAIELEVIGFGRG